jgi:hypothetical protein
MTRLLSPIEPAEILTNADYVDRTPVVGLQIHLLRSSVEVLVWLPWRIDRASCLPQHLASFHQKHLILWSANLL